MLKSIAHSLICCVALTAGSSAMAGSVITSRFESPEGSQEQKIFLDKDKLLFQANIKKKNYEFIYRSDKETIWIISPKENSYFEMTKEELERTVNQLQFIRSTLERQLQFLPEDKRKALTKNLPAKNTGQKFTFAQQKSEQKCGKFKCDVYEVSKEGDKKIKHEAYMAPASKLGISKDEITTLKKFTSFMEPVIQLFQDNEFPLLFAGKQSGEQLGVPVIVNEVDGDQRTKKHEIVNIKKKSLESSLFEVPQEMKKGPFPFFR